jgi:hypothetical protein
MSLFQKLAIALGLQDAHETAPCSRAADASGRALARKRQRLQEGFVVSEGMLVPRACTLRDMTPLGGSIEVWDRGIKASLLAGPLTLYLPSDKKEVDCAVVWRRDNSLGLKFISPFRAPRRTYG